MTDAEVTDCLARGRAGDEKAILELFHYMYPHVAKLVQANLPARESAEDLIQQVCGAPEFNSPGVSTEAQAFCILMESAAIKHSEPG